LVIAVLSLIVGGGLLGAVLAATSLNGAPAGPEAATPGSAPPVQATPDPVPTPAPLEAQASGWDSAASTAIAGGFDWRLSQSPLQVSGAGLSSINGGSRGFVGAQFATLYEDPDGTHYQDATCSTFRAERDSGTGDIHFSCPPYTDYGGASVTPQFTVFAEGDLLRWVFDIENPTSGTLSPGWYFTAEFPEQDNWVTSSGGGSRPFFTRQDRWVVSLPVSAVSPQMQESAIGAGVIWSGPSNADSPCIEPGGSFSFDGVEYIGISVNCFPSESVILPRPSPSSLGPGETWRVVIFQLLEPTRWSSAEEARVTIIEKMAEFDSLTGRLVRGLRPGPDPINW